MNCRLSPGSRAPTRADPRVPPVHAGAACRPPQQSHRQKRRGEEQHGAARPGSGSADFVLRLDGGRQRPGRVDLDLIVRLHAASRDRRRGSVQVAPRSVVMPGLDVPHAGQTLSPRAYAVPHSGQVHTPRSAWVSQS